MSLKPTFETVASMAGIKPPEAGARLLQEQLARMAADPTRPDAGAQGEAELGKWFLHYRRRETPGSIAAYMAAVEAALRARRGH